LSVGHAAHVFIRVVEIAHHERLYVGAALGIILTSLVVYPICRTTVSKGPTPLDCYLNPSLCPFGIPLGPQKTTTCTDVFSIAVPAQPSPEVVILLGAACMFGLMLLQLWSLKLLRQRG